MKHSKKLLSLFLSVVLLLGLLPTSALAADVSGDITTNQTWDSSTTFSNTVNLKNVTITVDGIVTVTKDIMIPANSTVTIVGKNGGKILLNGNGVAIDVNKDNAQLTLKDITVDANNNSASAGYLIRVGSTAGVKTAKAVFENVTIGRGKQGGINWMSGNLVFKGDTRFTGTYAMQNNESVADDSGHISRSYYLPSDCMIDVTEWNRPTEKVFMTYRNDNSKPLQDPFPFAIGAKSTDESLFEGYLQTGGSTNDPLIKNTKHNVYYAGGKMYAGTQVPSADMITEWEVDLGTVPNGCTVTGGAMRQLVTKNNEMTNVTITPGVGKTFAGVTIPSDFASALHNAELTHEVVGGKLVIKGTPTKDVNLSGVTWPEPVSNTKRVTLGTGLPTGVELATGADYGDLTQNITSWTEFKPVVLKATDGYVFDSGVVNALNQEFDGIELAAALKDNGDIEIKYSGNGDFNTTQIRKNIKEIISPVAVEATVTVGNTTTKYATLSAALNAANTAGSGTVEIKKNLSSAVSNAALNSGVTLKDTTGNTYKAVGNDGASIDVAANGKVTLNSGTLEVTPKNNTNASVTVNTGSGSTVVSGSDKFTVTAAKGNGSGSTGNDKATVTIANANGSVTTGTGLTFTAGQNGSTFPLDGSDLTGAGSNPGDAITVPNGKTAEIKVGEVTTGEGETATTTPIKVTVPDSNTNGNVTVKKGGDNGAMATVTVAKKGDSFKVGNTTYTAGADNSTFTIDENGNVKLISGGISLADGESTTGSASGKTIENPASSGNDTVTVKNEGSYDEVTVPAGGEVLIDGEKYINGGDTDLVLRVAVNGTVSVAGGSLKELIDEGSFAVGNTSGATITNPAGSGNDTLEVTSDGTKDRVTVPGGTDKSVTITKAGATTGETYFNNAANSDPLVIDVTADKGASLFSGSVALREGQGIGVYGNTITYTNSNNSGEALAVRIYEDGEGTVTNALINLKEGRSFTDKDGNTYTAKNGEAEFAVDKATGKICLISGSAEVTPAAGETPEAQVAKADNSSFYSVSGSKPFTVSTDKGNGTGSSEENAKASVTISTKGDSVTSGGLTFTAGENGSTFPLDGSKLNNNGDKLTVASGTAAAVEVGTKAGSTDPITVTVPAEGASGNSGATTITKGAPTIVKIGADNDSFSVNGSKVPAQGYSTKAGEEYAIDANGYATKVTARLYDADGKEINAGAVDLMLEKAISGQTVKMERPSVGGVTVTVVGGVTLKDMEDNAYQTVGNANIVLESGVDDVKLGNGTLTVTPATGKTAGVAVAGKANLPSRDFTPVSGEAPFTVTAGEGDGNGVGEGNAKATVTIPTTGNTVTVGASADTGMVFTAGAANSTFPLDGSKLSNVGDSVKFGASHTAAAQVDVGNGNFINISNNVAATVKKVSGGHTVTLDTAGGSFAYSYPVGEEGSGSVSYTAAVNNTTFFVGDDGKTALVSGAVKVSQTGSTDVRPDGWNSSVSVSVPAGGSDVTVSTVSGTPAKGKAEVASGKSVTIGDKTYTAAADDTAFTFDENGKVTLDSGKVELDKDESILGGISGVEIKNTSADEAKKVTVEKGADKDIVTVPAGGKVTIGGKEYTNHSDSEAMTLEVDAEGNVSLAEGAVDLDKDETVRLNGTVITNTKSGSTLTVSANGTTGTVSAKAGDSFAVGSGSVKEPSADMDFTINDDGTVSASLTNGQSVTINGVKYTGSEGGATLKLDQDGNLSISGSYSANIPGQSTHEISGRVTQDNNGVSGATVTLTQGGKEAVKLATVTTNPDGSYSFPAVPAGTYNVVVISGGKTMTKLVTVADGDVDMGELALPSAKVSSIVEVKPTSPVGAMVGGLDDVAEDHKDSSAPTTTHVEVKLTVKDDAANAEIAALAVNQTLTSLDFTINKKVGSDSPTPIIETNTVLEIILTFDTSNKTNITVYRKHGSESAAALRRLDTRPTDPAQYEEGTYYVGSGFVVVYTSKFSPYAIGYEEVSHSGSSGGSGSSSGSGASVGKTQNGSVSVSPKNAKTGETVTVTVKPDAGYKLGTLTVTDKDGNKLALTKLSDTQYTYVAPNGQVEVKAEFVKLGTDYASCAKDSSCPIAAFTDAKPTAWYHDGMHYCLDNGLMNGFGNGMIGPDHPTTRAQVVVMLWRLNGSPVVNYALDFDDVAEDMWYTEAIRWAKSTGVADGYGNGCFGPDDTITREQMVTILYRYAQNKGYDVSVGESTNILSFADATSVSEFAFPAMQWACGSGMVNGMDGANGTVILLPQGDTIRAQMATMLMRFCVEIVK